MPILIDFNQSIISIAVVAQNNFGNSMDMDMIRNLYMNWFLEKKRTFHDKYGGDIIFCCDARHVWRKDVFPFYKASRKSGREASTLDWEFIFESMNILKDELKNELPYHVLDVELCEADDIIAVLAKHFSKNEFIKNGLIEEPQKVLILSTDHDFKQLQILGNVDQYSPAQKKFIRENRPDLYLKEHIIRGDRGDGVPNFLSDDDCIVMGKRQKSVMSKKVDEWLEFDDPRDFCKTEDHLRNWHRNKQLVDLLTCIPDEIEGSVMDQYQTVMEDDKRYNILNYLIKYRLKNLMESAQDFI